MHSQPKILLVDDEPYVTDNLRLALRKQPWEVVTATSGREGLELLRSTPFDVVVSDERMPEMAGSEFLAHVARERPQTIRIILSGQASLDAAIRAINEAGIFRFLTKPCSIEDLVACLESAIEASRAARAEAEQPRSSSRQDGAAIEALDSVIPDLWLAFQPIIRTTDRSLFGYEALVRTDHIRIPHPGALFDAAEHAGRVLEVEAAIRDRVGRALTTLPEGATLFVNLHPASLADADFFERDNPLFPAANRIVLEVTERASLEAIQGLDARIRALKDLGFRIAVDDLGAGYAGLNSFAQLSPDVVKLDIDLIQDVDRSSTKRTLVESMIGLGRELGHLTVAEGIETDAELRTLTLLGCDLLQGYRLGRPAKGFSAAEPLDPPDGA